MCAEKIPFIDIIASDKNWVEGEAIRQLEQTATLPNMLAAIGMPDLHPGKGNPIGAAFVSKKTFYPYLVGNDVGCGMGLWSTNLKSHKVKKDKWVKKLKGLEQPWDGNQKEWLAQYHLAESNWDQSLGTIGGGNHFAELQMVESIEKPQLFESLGLSKSKLTLLVHSGSRGFGSDLLRQHIEKYAAKGIDETMDFAQFYLKQHDYGVRWATANRALIAHRFLSMISGKGQNVLDICHNSVVRKEFHQEECWLHRKGAAPSDQGVVMIPGSRGSMSYLVKPIGDQEKNAYSVAHGAGRKWNRHDSKDRLNSKFRAKDLIKTALGSLVICEDRDLLYEEAPQAYKNIDVVIQDLVDAKIIEVVAIFRPVITYKVRKQEKR
ncbi:MAG: release factor H-coupled RctB family protein [bacterium]|jgi:release factor H-coupled RctB family protein